MNRFSMIVSTMPSMTCWSDSAAVGGVWAAATDAEIAAAAIAPFVQKRVASLTRSREACEAELKIVFCYRDWETDRKSVV